MRTKSICLALAVVLLPAYVSAQWVQTSLDTGIVMCFAVRGSNLFSGTWEGSVFLSTNNGTSWTEGNIGLTRKPVVALVVLDTNMFAATGTSGEKGGGVFLSTDNGTTWTAVGLTDTVVTDLSVSGTNLFAGTWDDGVFLSTDDGLSWSAVNEGLPVGGGGWGYPSIEAFAVIGTTLFAGTYGSGVFVTTNNGTNWTEVNSGLTENDIYCLAVSGTNLFAGTGFWGSGRVFLTTNNGINWTEVSSGLPSPTNVNSLAVSATNLYAATYYPPSVFLSTNNGSIWTAVSAGLPHTDVLALAVNGTNLFAGTRVGVWRRPLSEMITSVEPLTSALPSEFLLQQNYPNPFNPSTTITYELPKSSDVKLSVYDVLGREVSVLVNERRDATVHEVEFDGSNLASGLYFYRLQTGDFVATKRLLLLK